MDKLKMNDYVRIINSNIYGKITSLSNNSIIFVTEDGKNIAIEKDRVEKYTLNKMQNVKINVSFPVKKENTFKNEIMLRHLNKEEALLALEKFISDAILNKEKKIRIIHGKNGGILREAVKEYLSSSPYIKKFELARLL